MRIDFWIDPACPYCWRPSRWLLDVTPKRQLDVQWRSISLLEKNRTKPGVETSEHVVATHRMLRVVERLRQDGDSGNQAAGRFYTGVGAQIHHDGVKPAEVNIPAVIHALGLDPRIAAAADDEALDEAIRSSMEAGLSRAGDDVGTPIITFDGTAGYFGPVVDPVPTGEATLRIFDAVHVLATTPGMWELKRSRDGAELQDLARPATVTPAA